MNVPEDSSLRRIGPFKRLVFGIAILALAIAACVLADRMMGWLYPRFAPESGRKVVEALLNEDGPAEAGFFVSHPYLFYTFRPGLKAFGVKQFNSRGHRGPEIAESPPAGVLRVLCIGGSTTASFPYVRRPEDAWPAQLEKKLETLTGLSVEVINAGLNGANSADLLAHYVFRNRHLGAHIVVMHLGGNDANALFFEDYDPEYTHYTLGWQTGAIAARPHERIWLRSHTVKWLYALWLQRVSLDHQLGRSDITTIDPRDALERVRQTEPEGFERNVDFLLKLIRLDGAQPVIFPFVWAPEPKFRKDPLFGRYFDAFALAFEKNRSVLESLAARHGALWLPLDLKQLDESMFKDWCHMNEDGERVKARHVAEGIRELAIEVMRKRSLAIGDCQSAVGLYQP
ncbi:MAG: GDSL-type esterase/lipase family protein [Kiritimatiellae bacterium]|nr:GDSL-type esterase/lipase family protein [Kiritimatiellia bacterium]MDW8459326.1 GDSL-type esterase/lipase family protein [Verrucomicrobiota bacterium]